MNLDGNKESAKAGKKKLPPKRKPQPTKHQHHHYNNPTLHLIPTPPPFHKPNPKITQKLYTLTRYKHFPNKPQTQQPLYKLPYIFPTPTSQMLPLAVPKHNSNFPHKKTHLSINFTHIIPHKTSIHNHLHTPTNNLTHSQHQQQPNKHLTHSLHQPTPFSTRCSPRGSKTHHENTNTPIHSLDNSSCRSRKTDTRQTGNETNQSRRRRRPSTQSAHTKSGVAFLVLGVWVLVFSAAAAGRGGGGRRWMAGGLGGWVRGCVVLFLVLVLVLSLRLWRAFVYAVSRCRLCLSGGVLSVGGWVVARGDGCGGWERVARGVVSCLSCV